MAQAFAASRTLPTCEELGGGSVRYDDTPRYIRSSSIVCAVEIRCTSTPTRLGLDGELFTATSVLLAKHLGIIIQSPPS